MEEKKNPHFPEWKIWILVYLAVSQFLMAAQLRQVKQELWKAEVQQDKMINQLADQLNQHLIDDNLYKTMMVNQKFEEENRKLEDLLRKATGCK